MGIILTEGFCRYKTIILVKRFSFFSPQIRVSNSYLFKPIYTSVCRGCCLKSWFKCLNIPNQPHTLLPAWRVPKDLNQSERESVVGITLLPYVDKEKQNLKFMLFEWRCSASLWQSSDGGYKYGNYWRNFIEPNKVNETPKERWAADGKKNNPIEIIVNYDKVLQ